MGDPEAQERHDPRVLALKAGLLAVWAAVSFGVCFFARDLQFRIGPWPFDFWMAAQGTVLKTGSGDELLLALRRVVAGETSFDSRHPARDQGNAALSPREREVLRLVASGATNVQIAEQLGIGRESVKTLISRAFAKLGATRRAEAVSEAHRRGLL